MKPKNPGLKRLLANYPNLTETQLKRELDAFNLVYEGSLSSKLYLAQRKGWLMRANAEIDNIVKKTKIKNRHEMPNKVQ